VVFSPQVFWPKCMKFPTLPCMLHDRDHWNSTHTLENTNCFYCKQGSNVNTIRRVIITIEYHLARCIVLPRSPLCLFFCPMYRLAPVSPMCVFITDSLRLFNFHTSQVHYTLREFTCEIVDCSSWKWNFNLELWKVGYSIYLRPSINYWD